MQKSDGRSNMVIGTAVAVHYALCTSHHSDSGKDDKGLLKLVREKIVGNRLPSEFQNLDCLITREEVP